MDSDRLSVYGITAVSNLPTHKGVVRSKINIKNRENEVSELNLL